VKARRAVCAGGVALLVLAVAGCGTTGSSGSGDDVAASVPSATAEAAVPAAPASAPPAPAEAVATTPDRTSSTTTEASPAAPSTDRPRTTAPADERPAPERAAPRRPTRLSDAESHRRQRQRERGTPASATQADAIHTAFDAVARAVGDGDWDAVCDQLLPATRRQLEQASPDGTDCSAAAERLMAQRAGARLAIRDLRVGEGRATAKNPEGAAVLFARSGGRWFLASRP